MLLTTPEMWWVEAAATTLEAGTERTLSQPLDARRLEDVKFSAALPVAVGSEMIRRRDLDAVGVRTVLSGPVVRAQGEH